MLIINDTLGTYGGSLTLILRICTRMVQRNLKTAVITESTENVEIVDKLQKLGVSIFNINVSKRKQAIKFLKSLDKDEPLTILTFVWNKYLDIEVIKNKCGFSFKNLIYCIHPMTFYKGKSFPIKFLRKKIVSDYSKVLVQMIENGSVFFMDEDCIDSTQRYFGFEFKTQPHVLALPMICNRLSDMERDTIIRNGYESQTIFTASRAEFPFKGYLFGLLDDFCELKKKYPNLKLQIVTGGDEANISQLESKFKAIEDVYPEDVNMSKWVEYDALLEIEKNTMLFIGMGTGILDAALLYKPAIAVKHDSYENLSDAYFNEKPYELCSNSNQKAVKLIDKVLSMSYSEYYDLCNKSFEAAKDIYDMDKFIDAVLGVKTVTDKCILKKRQIFSYKLNSMLNKLRHKNNFSYDAMQKQL